MQQTSQPMVPQLVSVWREGYGLAALRADALAGLTVAIVALPLSMAIAISSGVGPQAGLVTAIVGGFVGSALGGARFQIAGPAGAFIVLVAACVAQIGVAGLVLATLLSGGLLVAAGALRLGGLVRLVPPSVVLGFTVGIGVILLAAQLGEVLGLALRDEPAAIGPKLRALWGARAAVSSASVAVAAGVVVGILALRALRPGWPGMLLAVAAASVLVALAGVPVATIGSRFGALPAGLPMPHLPPMSRDLLLAALPWAGSFALLGAIETLLSAVVADQMTGQRHRPAAELVAQGLANVAAALFGGFCVTGLIARTVVNIRAGAHGPVAGMLHAVFLLGFMLVAAPLAGYIPLAALAGVLVVVSLGMIEGRALRALLARAPGQAAVAAVTFALVVLGDLSLGIVVGSVLGLGVARLTRQPPNGSGA